MSKYLDDALDEALFAALAIGVLVIAGILWAGIFFIGANIVKWYRRDRLRTQSREDFRLTLVEEGMNFETDDVLQSVFTDGGVKIDLASAGKSFPCF